MKFRAERDALVDAIAPVARVVSTRPATPATGGIHIKAEGDSLTLTATNLDLSARNEVAIGSQDDGVALLPAKLFGDIIRALPSGTVEVDVADDEARITAGRSSFGVRTFNAGEFPQLSGPSGEGVTLETAELSDALRQIVPAASTDENRAVLCGVLIAAEGDGIRLVGTDSYRLAIRDIPGIGLLAEGQSVLVPATALAELNRALSTGPSAVLHLGDREAFFRVGNLRMATRLIEGDFPNYRPLIPTDRANVATIDREPLMDALKRVKLLAADAVPVRLQFEAGSVTLSTSSTDVGTANEAIEASYAGADITVAVNPDYLRAGLEAAGGETVSIAINDTLKPLVVSGNEPGFTYIVMPVRV